MIVCSCISSGTFLAALSSRVTNNDNIQNESESSSAAALSFSHIIIDEAGQALLPEVLVPLSLASKHTFISLVGDPKQLGKLFLCIEF